MFIPIWDSHWNANSSIAWSDHIFQRRRSIVALFRLSLSLAKMIFMTPSIVDDGGFEGKKKRIYLPKILILDCLDFFRRSLKHTLFFDEPAEKMRNWESFFCKCATKNSRVRNFELIGQEEECTARKVERLERSLVEKISGSWIIFIEWVAIELFVCLMDKIFLLFCATVVRLTALVKLCCKTNQNRRIWNNHGSSCSPNNGVRFYFVIVLFDAHTLYTYI